ELAAQGEQGLLDVVARKHEHRPVGIEPAVEQGLADLARRLQGLGVADAAPGAVARFTLGYIGTLGRLPGPVDELVGKAVGKAAQRLWRAYIGVSVVARQNFNVFGAQGHTAVTRCCLHDTLMFSNNSLKINIK